MQNRIKELRKMKKMTQQELAEKIGVSQVQIGRLEKGERGLDLDDLPLFADALDCEPWEILPTEWQPFKLSDEEKEILKLFRKKTDIQNTVIQTENKTR